MVFPSQPLVLSDEERAELTATARSRSLPAADVQRARVVLLLADGTPYRMVADKLGCSQTTVGLWRRRFLEGGLEGLYGRHRRSPQELGVAAPGSPDPRPHPEATP